MPCSLPSIGTRLDVAPIHNVPHHILTPLPSLSQAEAAFLALFTTEILLKIYTIGFVNFFRNAWNMWVPGSLDVWGWLSLSFTPFPYPSFDFVVIFAAIVIAIDTTANSRDGDKSLDFVLTLRVLRLVRVLGSIERFQVIINTIMQLGPAISTYGAMILVSSWGGGGIL